jgi:2-keto-3-deoxy-L-rhamnonate aldolase RhmA
MTNGPVSGPPPSGPVGRAPTAAGAPAPSLKARARSGTGLRGIWLTVLGPDGTECLSGLDLDWVGLDTQHGALRSDRIAGHVRALDLLGLPALVRTAGHSRTEIQFALDAGAQGVIVPAVESAATASEIAGACHFPPRGTRSTGLSRPGVLAGMIPPRPDEDTLCLPMIETSGGLANAADIATVDGVDGLFVGPYDLGLSLAPDAPDAGGAEVLAAVEQVFALCAAAGKLTAVFAGAAPLAHRWRSAHLLAVDTDVAFLHAGAAAALAAVARDGPVEP